MPELPEVQTVVDELSELVVNKSIEFIEINSNRLVQSNSLNIDLLQNLKILSVSRRAKYILFHFSRELILITHLRMTGKFVSNPSPSDEKYIRACFQFKDSTKLYFVDVRQFGTFELSKSLEILESKLGPEPLSSAFDAKYLKKTCLNRNRPIKNHILDQAIVSGVGNIYADESLFLSHIRPNKLVSRLTDKNISDLVENIKLVLNKAIKNMGTSLSDYRTTKNISGENQNYLFVYGKEAESCKICQSKILRIKLSGRSAHYCPKCQS